MLRAWDCRDVPIPCFGSRLIEIGVPSRPSERFVVRMRVREDLRALVRTDTVATIQTDGIVGNAFIQLGMGTDQARVVQAGDVLTGSDPIEFTDLIQEGRDTFRLVSREVLQLNQGTLYPALLRMEQEGWISSKWGASEKNRKARFYSITAAGQVQISAPMRAASTTCMGCRTDATSTSVGNS